MQNNVNTSDLLRAELAGIVEEEAEEVARMAHGAGALFLVKYVVGQPYNVNGHEHHSDTGGESW